MLYASGEQTAQDIGMIAARLNALNPNVEVLGNEGNIYKIVSAAEDQKPILLVIDSAQTAQLDDVDADIGSAEQVRSVTNYITSFCKTEGVCGIIIFHETKSGDIAGPQAAQHLVDTVIRFVPGYTYDDDGNVDPETKDVRELISGKNRNGASGVEERLEMTAEGLKPLSRKKSKIFLIGD